MKRTPITRRTRLRKRGARAERDAEALRAFREAVLDRCRVWRVVPDGYGDITKDFRYRCEVCGDEFHDIDAHHMLPRSRSGAHDPSNGFGVCRRCHHAIHDHTHPRWKEFLR